jgi:hypothetical protein
MRPSGMLVADSGRTSPSLRQSRVALKRVAVLVAAAVLGGCALSLGPERQAQPEADSLTVDPFLTSLERDGALTPVLRLAEDASFSAADEFVSLSASTSRGDHERVRVMSETCPVGSPHEAFSCHYFTLLLREGADTAVLRQRVLASGGRIVRPSRSWIVLSADFETVFRRARVAGTWAGVAQSVPGELACFDNSCSRTLRGVLPVDRSKIDRFDGVLQITNSDTIRLAYTSGGGVERTVRIYVP